MEISEKIRYSREKKHISQEEIADALNIDIEVVRRWENGSLQIDINNIVKLSGILNVSLDYLLKDDDLTDYQHLNPNIPNNSEAESNLITETSKPSKKTALQLSYKTIKIWMIIGTILTPLSLAGTYLNDTYKPDAYLFFLIYIVTIPLCILGLKVIKYPKKKQELVGWGIVIMLAVSIIAGILILTKIENDSIVDDKSDNTIEDSQRILKKNKNPNKIIICLIVLVIIVALCITIPIVISNNGDNDIDDPVEEISERDKAWYKIRDDVCLYKKTDDLDSKKIYSGVMNKFDKKFEIFINYETEYNYQYDELYFEVYAQSWIDKEIGSYLDVTVGITIERGRENQEEFSGKFSLEIYDTSGRYVWAYSDCRHLNVYSLESCMNLYNVTIIQNKTQGFTNEMLEEFMVDCANEAMKEGFIYIDDYLKDFYKVDQGLSLFGITCLN